MGITNSNKTVSTERMDCGGLVKVTLALTASPNITDNPTDIVLILDRSRSMSGEPLASLKKAAEKFIDIIDEATDGSQDGQIGSGSHIGIVSFSTTATQDTQLITSVEDLKIAVNALSAGGNTNHADAFQKAIDLFNPASDNAKVMVMFTDGNTTSGPPPAPVAAAARAQGIVIYCIGLIGSSGLDVTALNDWATDPNDSHVAVTPDDDDLERLFEDLAANITKPGATNIVIKEQVSADFRIESIQSPTKGVASLTGPTTLCWTIDKLGVSANEGATLEFNVRHLSQTTGTRPVNQSIVYDDDENNVVIFPSPSVEVECGTVITPEACPAPVNVTLTGCSDTIEYDTGDVYLESLGRVLQLDVRLKNICPQKRVALAVLLTEVDANNNEHDRGMKTITVPAHYAPSCRDVIVKCIKFVLPEDLDVSNGTPRATCDQRNLKARFIAHYIDSDFQCCTPPSEIRD